jgi:hypothetical protein
MQLLRRSGYRRREAAVLRLESARRTRLGSRRGTILVVFIVIVPVVAAVRDLLGLDPFLRLGPVDVGLEGRGLLARRKRILLPAVTAHLTGSD